MVLIEILPAPEASPELPPELQRDIFEVCALRYPAFIPTLMLVAHHIKEWVEPFLFRTIHICDDSWYLDGNCDRRPMPTHVVRRVTQSKSASFLAQNVRNLLFIGPIDESVVSAIWDLCSGPLNIFVDLVYHSLPILAGLNITHLCTTFDCLFLRPLGPNHPMFSNLTHLTICNFPWGGTELWMDVARIPHLTHFSIDDSGYLPACPPILKACPKLRALLFLCKEDVPAAAAVVAEEDLRFVVFSKALNGLAEWQRGGPDWASAEEFIDKRLTGVIDRTFYVIEEHA
ncbi:hypothetical protein C8R43DRAFT_968965 [Mycena crocata]|nr:hypothetical protein C8R43DRAFT_968965 [Mycena crocata]